MSFFFFFFLLLYLYDHDSFLMSTEELFTPEQTAPRPAWNPPPLSPPQPCLHAAHTGSRYVRVYPDATRLHARTRLCFHGAVESLAAVIASTHSVPVKSAFPTAYTTGRAPENVPNICSSSRNRRKRDCVWEALQFRVVSPD